MIRRASTDDIQLIRQMADVAFRQTYSHILSPEQIEYMMDMMYSPESLYRQMTSLGHVFLIDDGIGYASFRRESCADDGREVFHLEKLYVMPGRQGCGVGRRLFDAVCRCVREASAGSPAIELNVNRRNPAVSFYEHLGMRRDREGDFDIGHGFYMNDYIMCIDL